MEEIDFLETNAELQITVNELNKYNELLSKKLAITEKLSVYYREKAEEYQNKYRLWKEKAQDLEKKLDILSEPVKNAESEEK